MHAAPSWLRLRLYIDARLARPTTLPPDQIKKMTLGHDSSAFDSIADLRIRNYEDRKLPLEPALLELFSYSLSLEIHLRLFSLLKDSYTSTYPEIARIGPVLIGQLVSRLECHSGNAQRRFSTT